MAGKGNPPGVGRPRGAENKDKPYRDALRMEIAAAATAEDPHAALRKVARAHLRAAGNGDVQAIATLADRLDGKPAQETSAEVHHTYDRIIREIVYPEHRDTTERPEDKDGAGIPTAH